MPRTAGERVASAPSPYTVSVGKATGVAVCWRARAASRRGSEGVGGRDQVVRAGLSGDQKPRPSPCEGTLRIRVLILRDGVAIMRVLV